MINFNNYSGSPPPPMPPMPPPPPPPQRPQRSNNQQDTFRFFNPGNVPPVPPAEIMQAEELIQVDPSLDGGDLFNLDDMDLDPQTELPNIFDEPSLPLDLLTNFDDEMPSYPNMTVQSAQAMSEYAEYINRTTPGICLLNEELPTTSSSRNVTYTEANNNKRINFKVATTVSSQRTDEICNLVRSVPVTATQTAGSVNTSSEQINIRRAEETWSHVRSHSVPRCQQTPTDYFGVHQTEAPRSTIVKLPVNESPASFSSQHSGKKIAVPVKIIRKNEIIGSLTSLRTDETSGERITQFNFFRPSKNAYIVKSVRISNKDAGNVPEVNETNSFLVPTNNFPFGSIAICRILCSNKSCLAHSGEREYKSDDPPKPSSSLCGEEQVGRFSSPIETTSNSLSSHSQFDAPAQPTLLSSCRTHQNDPFKLTHTQKDENFGLVGSQDPVSTFNLPHSSKDNPFTSVCAEITPEPSSMSCVSTQKAGQFSSPPVRKPVYNYVCDRDQLVDHLASCASEKVPDSLLPTKRVSDGHIRTRRSATITSPISSTAPEVTTPNTRGRRKQAVTPAVTEIKEPAPKKRPAYYRKRKPKAANTAFLTAPKVKREKRDAYEFNEDSEDSDFSV